MMHSVLKECFDHGLEVCHTTDKKTDNNGNNLLQADKKLAQLLRINQIGRFGSEGMGKVKWIGGYIDYTHKTRVLPRKKLKIRKALPHYFSDQVKELLTFALLHDFYNTNKHKSKIYIEPEIEDFELVERLRNHHEKTGDNLIRKFQKYDQIAAIITRKIKSPRTDRYNWKAIKKVDFEKLATEISEVSSNLWKLYSYIYESKELEDLNESLHHGHSSLRNHLLVVSNLIVQDHLNR